jgi:hypothetical protein
MANTTKNLGQEIVALNANCVLINDMVNNSIFIKLEEDKDVTLLPHTGVHQRLFNIQLVEFLSAPRKETLGLRKLPNNSRDHGYLFYLEKVCLNPLLNPAGGKKLEDPIKKFVSWLDAECVVERVWLPSINTELTLKLPRVSFIKICGDISKHGFLRLGERVKQIQEIFGKNLKKITNEEAFLVLPEFYEWFHEDILNYHISAIAEFLNNIGWGIYEYLNPNDKIITSSDSLNPVERSMFFNLKAFRPYMPKFEVTKYLKMRY